MEIVKLDPKQFGIEESKAADIASQFKPMLDTMVELEKEFNEVVAMPIEQAADKAKQLRLKYVKVRTGTDKIHKEQKAFYLSAGRFVDGWKNAQLFASQGVEKKLEDIEQYAANIEKERIAKLAAQRAELLLPFGINETASLNLGNMSDEIWSNFLTGTESNYKARIEAERLAEEKRLADIEAERIRIEEQRIENERLKAEAAEKEKALQAERAAAEVERKRMEDIAKAEKEKAEAILRQEREEAARLAKIQADKLAEEKAAAKKLADELQARKDAEAKAEAERLAAEKKAAKAPVKEKLNNWVNGFVMGTPPGMNEDELVKEILEKFNGFKQWALTKISGI